MTERIFDELEHGWQHLTSHLHHQQPATMQPASQPQEAAVSITTVITEVKHDIAAVAAKAEQIDEEAAAKIGQLEGNPVVDSLLAAAHVPVDALGIVVNVLDGLAAIYPKPDAAAPADPAMGDAQPEPAAAAS